MNELWLSIIKSFHYVMTPIGLFFCLCLFAAFAAIKFRRLARAMLILALFTLWFFATPKTSSLFFDVAVNNSDLPTCGSIEKCRDSVANYDVIIVAGWMEPFSPDNPRVDTFWSERLWHAAQLHRPGTPIIVNSSQYPVRPQTKSNQLTYAEIKLLSWGIPKSDIIISQPGRTTREAMLSAYTEAAQRHRQSVLLIAYAYRLPRKYLSLKKIIGNAEHPMKLITHKAAEDSSRQESPGNWKHQLTQWIPNEQTLSRSRFIMHEAAGLLAYRLGNWI